MMWVLEELSLRRCVLLVTLVLCCLIGGASCEEEEVVGTTEIPVPSEVIFRKGEGCAALATYTALSSFLANDFNTYMIDRITLHGVEKPFVEFRYGVPGTEGYKQSAIVLHHTKYHTVDSIKEVLHAYNVRPHPDLVRMKELHGKRQKEMNRINKAVRALQTEISIIERDYLIDYDQTDALIDQLYAEGRVAFDHNNETPGQGEEEGEAEETGESDQGIAIATDEIVHQVEEMAPEPRALITELLIKQSELKLAANSIRDEILPWLDSLREPLAVNRLRGVRYKFRLMEKKEALAARHAAEADSDHGAEGTDFEGEAVADNDEVDALKSEDEVERVE